MFVTAIDASKAFDRIDHCKLMSKLKERNLPSCFIRVISCWYSKLYSTVRWNSAYSRVFNVRAGVRQGGILSPILFNVYVDNLIEELKNSGYGCYICRTFYGCIMYADDLLLLSPSLLGLQSMLDICSSYGGLHDIIFNANKTVIMPVGRNLVHKSEMYIANQLITWVDRFKYLGVSFLGRSSLVVDVMPVKRKFYGALNSVFSRHSSIDEMVKLHLVRAFCLPLLNYGLGALELANGAINELGICWNDAFRKIFKYNRCESVKLLQLFCGCLDFRHMYDLLRLRFNSLIVKKLPFLNILCSSLELKFHVIQRVYDYYGTSGCTFTAAVYTHFQCAVMESQL